jgi:predicted TIM-barrel fold metal-dependent hydrolase
MRDLTLREFRPRSLLELPVSVVERARFPVIDAHNHLFGDAPPEKMLPEMDACGVAIFVNVTGNVSLPFDEKGYTIKRRPLEEYLSSHVRPHPSRFAALTMADFARWDEFTLFRTADNPDGGAARWADLCVQHLEADVRQGALGLKVTKELGLRFQDADGSVLRVDDERLYPIWRRAGELGVPVLIHTSDPIGFFLPADETNEHYASLQEFPGWGFQGSVYSKEELLAQRDRMIAAHPGTRFICAHVANYPEGLGRVSRFLDANPNVVVDFSARIDELGRQPYSARDFFIRYRDRILFGIDMPVRADIYRAYFRFLETRDEYFEYPDYIGRWGHCRWRICGLHLPEPVLRRIYHENALTVIPGLEASFRGSA